MKKLFEPIKLRENSRERVLRELISYNDNKGKNEETAKSTSKIFSDNKSQRELKPRKRKKTSIVMEVLAGAAVIAMIAGIIFVSINKSSGIKHQPAKSTGSQDITEKSSDSKPGQNNSLQGALPADTPSVEFISSRKLGISIAFNRQYFKDYIVETEGDGIVTLYQEDAGTETGLNWNNILISGSGYSYEEEIYNWTNDMYKSYYGSLQNIYDVTIGNLYSDYLSELGIASNTNAAGIPATKFSFSYELPDVNTSECTDVYVIDAGAYHDSLNSEGSSEAYKSYTIKVSYQIFHNDNNIEYSTKPEVIYETIDSFALTPFTKKTCYILANGTDISIASGNGSNIHESANFTTNYADDDKAEISYGSYYSFFSSASADITNDFFETFLPVGHLYDVSGIKDIYTNNDFYLTFNNMVAIDLYYPDYYTEKGYDSSATDMAYPSYGVLHSPFTGKDTSEKDTDSPDGNVNVTKSFEIFPKGDKLISVNDKYCTIYGVSEDYINRRSPDVQNTSSDVVFNYDYVIYVPIEDIFDVNGNSIGNIIGDINEINPALTMSVYYDGTELETFPAQIYADKVVVYGLETTGVLN